MSDSTFFHRWGDVARVATLGIIAYVLMVIALRVTGKRTLSKLNAFDLVITVALGSVLATIALSRDVSLIEGAAAIAVLVVAQWVVAWSSIHSSRVARAVRGEATVVFHHGRFDANALRRTRLLRLEIDQAIRASGFGDYEKIAAVVLETDGSLSVVSVDSCDTGSALPSTGMRDAPGRTEPHRPDPDGGPE